MAIAPSRLTQPDVSVAIIGSFKQHYEDVRAAVRRFRDAGITVRSPLGADIVEEGIDFVRFTSDDPSLDDYDVQSLALHRILGADAVYVVAPGGYLGRTTCYEIGRAVQAGRPVYFSEPPVDLPLRVPTSSVVSVETLVDRLIRHDHRRLHEEGDPSSVTLERDLIEGRFLDV
jgi:hypothetical protein